MICFAHFNDLLTDRFDSVLLPTMGIFKKKVMYTSLPSDGDEERSTYFGESSLDDGGFSAAKSSVYGICKPTFCKAFAFILVFVVVFSGKRKHIIHWP